jgi:homoserine dehydrogenase
LIGSGAVGQGLLEILRSKADELQQEYGFTARVVAVVTKSRGALYHPQGLDIAQIIAALKAGGLAHYQATAERDWDALRLARDGQFDVLIEASPTDLQTGQPALDIVRAALTNGKDVVLANKGPVAVAYAELRALAAANQRHLRFEGTVMGGTPSIRLALQALAGCRITQVRGIVNGTTNYILTQMESGQAYDTALAQAQALGYAETDPSGDVDGWDAAGKAAILSALIFNKRLDVAQMSVQGISGITAASVAEAAAQQQRWKLIATITPDGGSVQPVRLPISNPLAGVSGITNAITYTTDLLGDVTLIGPGAGGVQTGFALLSDLLDIQRLRG